MTDDPRCANCPLLGTDKACPAVTRKVPRYCQLVDPKHPAFNPQYISVLKGEKPAAPRFVPPGRLAVRAHLTSWTGYGHLAEHLGRQLDRLGFPVGFLDAGTDSRYQEPAEWVSYRRYDLPAIGAGVLQVTSPVTPALPTHPTTIFTMWESSHVPPFYVDQINRSTAVIVPCKYNEIGFRDSGVTVPIHVVPLGYDVCEGYSPKPYASGKPFTVGLAGRTRHGGVRKGLNEGIDAFSKAFDKGEDVRLEVKIQDDCVETLDFPEDPRISLVTAALSPSELADWYGGLDCLLVPSKGEGWGLHTLQAMACGRPVIACRHSGTAEFFDGRCGWELPFSLEPAGEIYGGIGSWAVPAVDGMVLALRDAYGDPERCRELGRFAGERARAFTWDAAGAILVETLRSIGLIGSEPVGEPLVHARTGGCGCGQDRPRVGGGERPRAS